MLLTAVPEESYCPKSQNHMPWSDGTNMICYRCGFLFGKAPHAELGSQLDY